MSAPSPTAPLTMESSPIMQPLQNTLQTSQSQPSPQPRMENRSSQPSSATEYRKLLTHVLERKVNMGTAKSVILTYDHELGPDAQQDGVLERVERLLGTTDIIWPAENIREEGISIKVHSILKRILAGRRYIIFEFFAVGGKHRMRIRPQSGAPPHLPHWLASEYIIPDAALSLDYEHESGSFASNQCLQNGDKLHRIQPQLRIPTPHSGTLGLVMTTGGKHVVPTLSHLLETGEKELAVGD